MELYTLDRRFLKQESIDKFESVIWTERYYGDGDFELNVSASPDTMTLLPKGQLMMCEDSDIPMILEHREVKDKILKVTGISLLKWMNNRILRTSNDHSVRERVVDTKKAGELLEWVVQNFLISGAFLNGSSPIAIISTDRNRFRIPGLVIGDTDTSGAIIEWTLPFGPVYDALNAIATTYEIGMNIKLDYASEDGPFWAGDSNYPYNISFNNYVGSDRTSEQSINPVIRFSPEMDSFTNITDLDSLLDHRNLILAFAVNAPATYMTNNAGRSTGVADSVDGFDLRIYEEFSDFDTTGLTVGKIGTLLNEKAKLVLSDLKAVQLIDGEIVQNKQIKYGVDYFLGDSIEVEGNSGLLQKARITEYIRSQDAAGERAYPTVAMIDE